MKDFQATRTNGEPYRGVRYREHPSRKHGLHPDRYYFLKFWARGRTMTEGVGWASEGTKPSDAHKRLIDIKAAIKAGTYETPAERKAREESERQAKEEQDAESERAALTFGEVFEGHFFPYSKSQKRNAKSWQREEALFRLWIKPVIGKKALADVAPFDLEKIRSKMKKAGRSARSITYAFQLIRQVFRYAQKNGLFSGEIPTTKVDWPKFDNMRVRYLTEEEAALLLEELLSRSQDLHDMAALSLFTGMRAGEIFSLTWACVDLQNGTLTLLDTKNGRTRTVFLNEPAQAILEAKAPGKPEDLVFPGRGGVKIVQASDAFNRAVDKLGFNNGITDRRQRVTFHTLRHTHASWLVNGGTPIYTVQRLLGHRDLSTTARYSHTSDETLKAAVGKIGKPRKPKKRKKAEAANE